MVHLVGRCSLRTPSWICGVCLAITLPGLCQQVSSQVDAGVGGASVSSGVQAGVRSGGRAASFAQKSNGAGSVNGLGVIPLANDSRAFAGSELQTFPSAMVKEFCRPSAKNGLGKEICRLPQGSPAGRVSATSNATRQVSGSMEFVGSGVSKGQFPDSTRDIVLPSPLLSGNSLQFFGIQMPEFSPSFDTKRHLNPSYVVTPSGKEHSSQTRRHFRPTRSLSSGLPLIPSTSFGSQIHPTLGNDPLQSNSIADPLKSQSIGWLNTNQPN